MSIKQRLRRLESRPAKLPDSPIVQEMHELDENIARLTKEIEEIRSHMTPEELASAKAAEAETSAKVSRLVGLYGFDAAIEWLEAEIRADEAELAESFCQGEGGTG